MDCDFQHLLPEVRDLFDRGRRAAVYLGYIIDRYNLTNIASIKRKQSVNEMPYVHFLIAPRDHDRNGAAQGSVLAYWPAPTNPKPRGLLSMQ
jgi:hypothetical protein